MDIICAMAHPLTSSRVLLVADRRELPSKPRSAPLRRYRLARLRECFGEQLDEPDVRFELELALRGRPG